AKGDHDRAIADYTKVIALAPNFANAYNNRGTSYRAKGDDARAIADYTKAIELDPKSDEVYRHRAHMFLMEGELDKAIADYDKAIENDPKDANHAGERGLARFSKGDFKNAAADLLTAIQLGDGAYSVLLRFLARTRIGEAAEAELESNAARLKTKDWPFAVTELYLGKRSPAAMLDAAATPDDRCEAQFYIGQWHLLKGNQPEAEAGLKAAVATCDKDFPASIAAIAELKRLKP
ncbi:MAG: tetratricopeptide repeat protein, partial [Hyphomicrobium sp.]